MSDEALIATLSLSLNYLKCFIPLQEVFILFSLASGNGPNEKQGLQPTGQEPAAKLNAVSTTPGCEGKEQTREEI